MRRNLIYAQEYLEFERQLNVRTREKLRYAAVLLETMSAIPSKFVKKLVNTDFYELRVSTDNETRIILFAVDNDNINLASTIIFLNGFTKKSTKDYNTQIKKAINILTKLL